MTLGISYIDGTTYIYDLLYEGSTITVGEFTLAQALLLSIKMGCLFDYNMDELDEGVQRYIKLDKEECEELISGECENLSEKENLAELLMKIGKIYFRKE